MKSYIINLLRASERRERITNHFDHYGVEFSVIPGIDWQNITDQIIFDNVHPDFFSVMKNSKRPQIRGLLACWLSHRKAWVTALENNERIVAIFEDDAMLTQDTNSALDVLQELSEDSFDIAFLYNGKPRKPLYPVLEIDDKFKFNLVRYQSIGAVGYVITQRAMKKLLYCYPQMNLHIDGLLHYYWWHGLKTYILTPQVVFHGEPSKSHLSYNDESIDEITLRRLGLVSSSHKLVKKYNRFKNRLFTMYLPQIPAFRKRLKFERTF